MKIDYKELEEEINDKSYVDNCSKNRIYLENIFNDNKSILN